MDQLEDAVKVGNRLNVFRVCLQVKRGSVTLDAQVLGTRRRLDAEGEQVSDVGAVPDEERAGGLGREHAVGLLPGDGAPVEAALLELVERGEDHLVLRLGGERLVTVRQPHVGVQEAAAHCEVKLAVSYHGAVPAHWAAWGSTGRHTDRRRLEERGSEGRRRGREGVSPSGKETPEETREGACELRLEKAAGVQLQS